MISPKSAISEAFERDQIEIARTPDFADHCADMKALGESSFSWRKRLTAPEDVHGYGEQ